MKSRGSRSLPSGRGGVDFSPEFNMLRVITLNLNGIRSAAAKGFLALARATKGRCACACRRSRRSRTDLPTRNPHARQAARATSTSRTRRATAASASTAARTPDAIVDRLRQPRVRRRGALPASRLRQALGRVDVPAVGLELGASASRRSSASWSEFLPLLRKLARERARVHPVRRLEHRPPGDRPEELALEPEELRLPARGARLAHARCSTRLAGSTCSGASTRDPSSTPGGRTAARPGRRTWAGASTTRSPRRASRRRR